EDCTVTQAHIRTTNLPELCRMADIVVVAIGKARFIQGEWLKPGAIVIDVGINRPEDKITGDVDFDSAITIAGAITPVPGGVGPMTIAALLENTLEVAEKELKDLNDDV
ncbi:MAG: bifunctional methylenetetrahydrofolate dehydrogenase/methenyltetrahydrofolate cyclohydrolase FolD, partial [Alphaproteobacteria bacterium]|nr:bifunctional methylenetetrahydrofolate dehydrogenase/methenyltetrahydrofolate cyclohydrolase FolD [Alphaproteobacteria bacterium]